MRIQLSAPELATHVVQHGVAQIQPRRVITLGGECDDETTATAPRFKKPLYLAGRMPRKSCLEKRHFDRRFLAEQHIEVLGIIVPLSHRGQLPPERFSAGSDFGIGTILPNKCPPLSPCCQVPA